MKIILTKIMTKLRMGVPWQKWVYSWISRALCPRPKMSEFLHSSRSNVLL